MPLPLHQAKAQNDGLFYTVLLLLLVAVLALRVEIFGKLGLDAQRLYFQQRAEKIAVTQAKYRQKSEGTKLYWCGPYVDEKGVLHVPKLKRHGVLKGI